MLKKLERKLRRKGKERGLGGERLNAYVYGALRKGGWKPGKGKGGLAKP